MLANKEHFMESEGTLLVQVVVVCICREGREGQSSTAQEDCTDGVRGACRSPS